MKKLSRNEPCLCGSGKQYKQCCIAKGFELVVGSKVQAAKNMPDPDIVRHLAVEDMKPAGIDPALIYAYNKDGHDSHRG